MPAFLLPLLLGAGGAVAGGLANRRQTTTSNQNQSSSSSSTGSASSRRFLLPEQQAGVGQLSGFGSSLMSNPMQGLDPGRTSMRRNVTRQFDAVPGQLASRMMAYGGDRSGKMGRAMRMAEQSKAGALADVEDRVSMMGLDRQMQGADIISRLLGQNFGADTTSSESSTGQSSMSGTSTGPANVAGGAATSGLSGLAAALALGRYLNG